MIKLEYILIKLREASLRHVIRLVILPQSLLIHIPQRIRHAVKSAAYAVSVFTQCGKCRLI